MVAVINFGKSILRTLNYNENKVKENVAQCIGAYGYPKDHDRLTFSQKYNRLKQQAELSQSVTLNSVHISLNFAPEDFPPPAEGLPEKEILAIENAQAEKLNLIAEDYMNRIGFGNQPYLVYKHNDSGHPHIHIVTLKTDAKGVRIETNNIGRNESYKASRELEVKYGLTPATGKDYSQDYLIKPINVEKVVYGRKPTKREMTRVLTSVLKSYKFTSLPELNAVFGLYNILADPGDEKSNVYRNGGLYYRLIGPDGQKVGIPIKASDFYNAPTLKKLHKKFIENSKSRQKDKQKLVNAIHLELLAKPGTFEKFKANLQKKGIHVVPRYTKTGQIFGLTYVDHVTKSVFNGSDLGKSYAAKGIMDSLTAQSTNRQPASPELSEKSTPKDTESISNETRFDLTEQPAEDWTIEQVIDLLFHTEYTNPNLPYPLRAKKKRKKKK